MTKIRASQNCLVKTVLFKAGLQLFALSALVDHGAPSVLPDSTRWNLLPFAFEAILTQRVSTSSWKGQQQDEELCLEGQQQLQTGAHYRYRPGDVVYNSLLLDDAHHDFDGITLTFPLLAVQEYGVDYLDWKVTETDYLEHDLEWKDDLSDQISWVSLEEALDESLEDNLYIYGNRGLDEEYLLSSQFDEPLYQFEFDLLHMEKDALSHHLPRKEPPCDPPLWFEDYYHQYHFDHHNNNDNVDNSSPGMDWPEFLPFTPFPTMFPYFESCGGSDCGGHNSTTTAGSSSSGSASSIASSSSDTDNVSIKWLLEDDDSWDLAEEE